MGKLRNPNPPPVETQFTSKWVSGAASQRVSLPPVIAPSTMAIAKVIDKDPTIAAEVLEFAEKLLLAKSTKK